MKKLLALVLALSLLLACGCSKEKKQTSTGTAFRLGLSGPLTGSAAIYGIAAKNGAELAVKEINALGGIQFELNAQDDENDAEKGVNAYHSLLDWGMQIMIGTVTTTPCLTVSTEANIDRVFLLTPSASSADIVTGKDNVFQMCFSDPNQGSASAQYIAEHFPQAKIAVIYDSSSDYSTGIYQTFRERAEATGLRIVSVGACTEDTIDFSVQVGEAKSAGADLVFLPIYYTPASLILKEADAIGYAPTFFGVDGMDGILTLKGFDVSLAEGVMLLTPFAADAPDEKTQAFVRAYEEAYGETPIQFAADAYDCVWAVYQALTDAGASPEASPEALCDLLIAQFSSMRFSGLTGAQMQWKDGFVDKPPMAVVIQDGKYTDAG